MMATLQGRIEGIIKEFARLQTMPARYRDKDDNFGLPRMIATGNGDSLIVSLTIDQAIAGVADHLMASDSTLSPKFTRAEWRASVRRAFGPALDRINPGDPLPKSAAAVLFDIKSALAKLVANHSACKFAFGCTLFGNTNIRPFQIGPVRFELRLDWLGRKHSEGGISAVSRRRIERRWSSKRLGRRKRSHDSSDEGDILDTVDTGTFVCSVTTNGLGSEAGREKALVAARLATAAVALLWQTPSKALNGLNLLFDRSPHRQKVAMFIPGKGMFASSYRSHMPHGPSLKTGEWEALFKKRSAHFSVVGQVLDYVVSPSGKVARPKMMNTLAHALLWFHEGCRETVASIAIVKFSTALDALACGRGTSGIRKLITAQLGMQEDKAIRLDGPTMKQVVEEIYSQGRSRTIHGNNDRMGHDWDGTRIVAEWFGRHCLIMCLDWAAENPLCNEPLALSRC
jgi:hypothetical protein